MKGGCKVAKKYSSPNFPRDFQVQLLLKFKARQVKVNQVQNGLNEYIENEVTEEVEAP